MTTFIKTKFNISDDQTNIDKYRLAENITEYPIISILILQRIIITNFCGPGKVQYRIWNHHRISKLKKKIVKSVHKQEIGLLWSSESFEGK